MNTELLRQEVLTLDVETVPPEAIGPVLRKLNAIRELEKDLRKVLTDRLLARVLADGDLTIDGVRWYPGFPKTYAVVDVPTLLRAILEACGGDLDAFFDVLAKCLAAGWFKVSELKLLLGEATFAGLVSHVEKPKLLEGVPTKQLLSCDPSKFGRAS